MGGAPLSATGEPPARERPALGRLESVPTRRPPTAPLAADLVGVDLSGTSQWVALATDGGTALLLFLSADCDGCQPFWPALADPQVLGLEHEDAVVVVARPSPREDPAAVRALVPAGVGRPTVVLSLAAWSDYRVQGPPFFALVHAGRVATEGVAWSVEYVAEHVREARGHRESRTRGAQD